MKKDLLTWLRGIAGKSPRVLWAAAFALGLFTGASSMASDYGAGLFVGHISGIDSLDKTVGRPKPDRIVASIEHAANEDPAFWGDRTMWVYWGQVYLDGLEYWFGENIGGAVYLVIDGETILDDNSPSTTTHGTIQRPAGWYDFELRMYNGLGQAEPDHDNSSASSERGFCYAKGVPEAYRPILVWSYLVPVDPGDGTFFRRDKDLVRTISVNFTGGQGGNTRSRRAVSPGSASGTGSTPWRERAGSTARRSAAAGASRRRVSPSPFVTIPA